MLTGKKRLVQVLLAAVGAYAVVALFAFALQRRLIYPARGSGRVPELSGATLERLRGADGRTVHALYAKASAGAPTLVHFHGNGEELADMVDFVDLFRTRGLGVLAVEYPGYGLSRDCEPSESAIYQDAEVALKDLVQNKGVSPASVVLSGQSLGTGVAVEMARSGHGGRDVLLSPFTSITDVANRYFPILPNSWLVRDTFDSASKAPAIGTPVLVAHGTDDEVIPFELGKTLAGLFPNARFVALENGRHNDLFARGEELVDNVTKFCRDE
jgi:pimeloyl-ACP methyl ester carboxylesterase